MLEAALYLVSTPIGNVADITARAVDTLRAADVVYAEDTRRTGLLLRRLEVRAELRSLHEHNEATRCAEIVARLGEGRACALVTDAGTPVLSDPGARAVAAAIGAGYRVVPVPGPSALVAALTVAGFDVSEFTFLGFAPRKGPERSVWLRDLVSSSRTVACFESPRRLTGLLRELVDRGAGGRRCAVCREMTKRFEETRRGTVAQLLEYYTDTAPRGEVTLVVEAAAGGGDGAELEARARRRADELAVGGESARRIVELLQEELGMTRNAAYRTALGAVSASAAGRRGGGPRRGESADA